jgi:hypothetical protein
MLEPSTASHSMSTPPPLQDSAPSRGLRESVRSLSRAQRELILFGAALIFGVLLMPLLIWMGGNRVLGPYSHGQNPHAGPFALLGDFLIGLGHGSAVFWAVALGPAVFILLVRLFWRALHAFPARRG